MEGLIRTFVAVEISEPVREEISKIEELLRKEQAQVSWVKPENLHLTLKFLGDVESARIEDVVTASEEAISGMGPFVVSFSGLGAFPGLKRPRVVWVGIKEGAESLAKIQSELEERLAQRGFEREKRRFSPHLTIGRVRSPAGVERLAARVEKTEFESQKMQTERIAVMRSDLKPTGAVYTPLAVCSFG